MAQKSTENQVVISIDPGESISGVAVIMLSKDGLGKAQLIGFNEPNSTLISKIKEYYVKWNTVIVVEDILPYRQKVSLNVIATCKFIGELNYRLNKQLKAPVKYIGRGKVKKWIFEAFPAICVDRIDKRIAYLDDYGEKNDKKRYRNKDGGIRKASFHFVDDRVVIAAMKEFWKIPTPKPGKKNELGFSSHSWQALGLATHYILAENLAIYP